MTFLICNIISGECTVAAPTPELIEREFNRVDAYHKPRGADQMICEVPDVLGVNLTNYRQFPRNMIFDGIATWAKRKAVS